MSHSFSRAIRPAVNRTYLRRSEDSLKLAGLFELKGEGFFDCNFQVRHHMHYVLLFFEVRAASVLLHCFERFAPESRFLCDSILRIDGLFFLKMVL